MLKVTPVTKMVASGRLGRGAQMPNTQTNPDTFLAYVHVLRLTDRLLEVAAELREARDRLQVVAEKTTADASGNGGSSR